METRALSDIKPPRFIKAEKETLVTFLDYLRDSVVRKLDGVSESDLRRSPVPSGTSLLSLVQHLTAAEVLWFQIRFAATDNPEPDDPLDDELTVDKHIAHYRAAITRGNEIVDSAADLGLRCADPDYNGVDLRWVLVHMIEETSRHAGHADIIREQIDGATGR
jgi:hypothetical protein